MNHTEPPAPVIDLRGLDCPLPVIRTRDAMKTCADLVVLVSTMDQAENIRRMASRSAWSVTIQPVEDSVRLRLNGPTLGSAAPAPDPADLVCSPSPTHSTETRPVIAIGSDIMGRGSEELGKILIRAFLSTQKSLAVKPKTVVLFNAGVRLATESSHVLNELHDLEHLGVELLVCGTCLDYFNLKGSLRAGVVSNMLDIATALSEAGHVISV